jgi:hypothetical protein
VTRPASDGHPRLFAQKADELHLSSELLLALARATFERGFSFRFRARGTSMTPFIRDGDVITLEPLAGRPATLGEVVAFIHPASGGLVVHRVVACPHRAVVLIRGDNNACEPDGLLPMDRVLARVTAVTRDGRPVWLGLGPERRLVALLSRLRLLILVWRILTPGVRAVKRARGCRPSFPRD